MEDLKQLLHALGLGLSYRTVKELSTFATDLRRSERVYYRVCVQLVVYAHLLCQPMHSISGLLQPWTGAGSFWHLKVDTGRAGSDRHQD